MIRLLYLTHRWVGVALASFMLLWLSSGLIIAYSSSLLTTPEDRLSHAQILHPENSWLSFGEALGAVVHDARQEIVNSRLARVDDEPVWLLEDASGERFAASAIDGDIRSYSVDDAMRIARRWLAADSTSGKAPLAVSYVDTFDASSALRNHQAYKPFHRFAVDDGFGSELIVSAKTGEVLQVSTLWRRSLYYAGNFIHLFRPLDFLRAGDLRRNTLFWCGLFAFVAGATGIVIGWLRWKPGFFGGRTYSGGRTQPYREFWLRYHFWAGLIGGAFAVLWAFSGALSTNPMQIFSEPTASPEELARFRGGDWPSTIAAHAPELSPELRESVVEIGWSHLGDQAQLLAYDRSGRRIALDVSDVGLDKDALLAAAQRLAGEQAIAGQALLTNYDSYYYPNRRQGALDRPLPVMRIDLSDSAHTSLYIDPQDGRLVTKIDSSRRAYRWLYVALHHWDFGWLHQHAVWIVWITIWISLGLVLALSSVVIGWRRLRRTVDIKIAPPRLAGASTEGQSQAMSGRMN
ncbi:PepSY domain-containing protein [Methylocapsa acidiphila]|uniref:PepSY domain-containing protein n=1 Tax=Methylocapsa acidiphila TaxID=133552 RepID=UPI0004020ABD|nr:PepSY domain-containing protein [Methylocapsa acidiphila]